MGQTLFSFFSKNDIMSASELTCLHDRRVTKYDREPVLCMIQLR